VRILSHFLLRYNQTCLHAATQVQLKAILSAGKTSLQEEPLIGWGASRRLQNFPMVDSLLAERHLRSQAVPQ
jgi:hypothetical protein